MDVDVEEEDTRLVAEYDVGGGYTLLVVSCGRYGVTLELCHPGAAKPVELGWDGLAHPHPHALRWPGGGPGRAWGRPRQRVRGR